MNIESIKPRNDNVLIRLAASAAARTEETKTPGGIIIPKIAETKLETHVAAEATVVAAGPGHYADQWLGQEEGHAPVGSRRYIPMDPEIVPGARVLIERPDLGDRIWSDEREEYRMVRANCIAAVLT